jgi:hypothetical protein
MVKDLQNLAKFAAAILGLITAAKTVQETFKRL